MNLWRASPVPVCAVSALSTAWLPRSRAWITDHDTVCRNYRDSGPLESQHERLDMNAERENKYAKSRTLSPRLSSIVTSMNPDPDFPPPPLSPPLIVNAREMNTATSVLRQSSRATRRNWLIIATRQWKLLRPTILEDTHALELALRAANCECALDRVVSFANTLITIHDYQQPAIRLKFCCIPLTINRASPFMATDWISWNFQRAWFR